MAQNQTDVQQGLTWLLPRAPGRSIGIRVGKSWVVLRTLAKEE